MYYEDDFYNEYSEFDKMIDEFKQSIAKSVKEEYLERMKKLEKENEELQEVKNNFQTLENEHREKMRELEYKTSKNKSDIRRERLDMLLQDFKVIMYKVNYKYIEKPKCNKCSDGRKIYFIAPSGKQMHEMCECSKEERIYIPGEHELVEFRISNDKNTMLMWYKIKNNDDDGYGRLESSSLATILYESTMEYEHLEAYDTFFKTIEDCQKYCNWLNLNNRLNK